PDLPQLAQVGGELAGHVVPGDVARRVQDPGRLVLRVLRAEVGEEPRAQPLGLAHVDDPAEGVGHPVDGRAVLGERADPLPQLVPTPARWRWSMMTFLTA